MNQIKQILLMVVVLLVGVGTAIHLEELRYPPMAVPATLMCTAFICLLILSSERFTDLIGVIGVIISFCIEVPILLITMPFVVIVSAMERLWKDDKDKYGNIIAILLTMIVFLLVIIVHELYTITSK